MAFCKNCGNQLESGQSFCNQCGTDNRKNETLQTAKTNQTRSRNKRSISKKAWFFIISAAIILIAALGTHMYFSTQYKPEKVVSSFEKAVKSKDEKLLVKMINEGQNQITVKESEIDGYIQYLTKENDFSELINELEKQSVQIENDVILHPIKDDYGNKLFILAKKDKKKWGLYDQYVVQVVPFTVNLSTYFPDTKVSLNGKKVKTLKTENEYVEIGQFLPSNYKVLAEYAGEYSTLKSEKTIDFSIAEENVIYHDIELDGAYVDIYSNYEDAKLFVNGKYAQITVEDASGFGPLATDGSVKLYAERTFPTGLKKSETVTVEDDTSIDLDFEEAETEAINDPQETLQSFLNSYISDSMLAINYGDFSYVSDYLDPAGPAYKESKDYAQYLYEKGIKEDNLKVEVTNYEIVDGNTFKVNTFEEYEIYYEGDMEPTFKAFNTQYLVKVDDEGDMNLYQLISTEEVE